MVGLKGNPIFKWKGVGLEGGPGHWGESRSIFIFVDDINAPESPFFSSVGLGTHDSDNRIFIAQQPERFHWDCARPSVDNMELAL